MNLSTATKLIILATLCFIISGCLYRSDGVFNHLGDSDYKLRFEFMRLFAIAEEGPKYIQGFVLAEDRIHPLTFTNIALKKGETVLQTVQTGNEGLYIFSLNLVDGVYRIKIVSDKFEGGLEVEINKRMTICRTISAENKASKIPI